MTLVRYAALATISLMLLPAPVRAQPIFQQLVSPNAVEIGFFGNAVAGVPDVDGDGHGDLLVGAPGEDVNAPLDRAGRAYVFSGATGALLHELASPNPEVQGGFGISVAGVSDVDGDGRGDLLVGASGKGAGRAYVFSGATGALLHELASPNQPDGSTFGFAVAGVPDVDGDGHGDLLVGAFFEGSPGASGRAYLFSGATGVLLLQLAAPNPQFEGRFGIAVAGVPDVDGDGRGDLLVGARRPGPAYVFSGATGTFLYELASPNQQLFGRFGERVSGVADVDGDGRGDLLVGAPGEDFKANPAQAGWAYVYSGATGALLHELTSPNEEFRGEFGRAVSGVPDMDGDGRGDLLVGAPSEYPGASPGADGRAYVFSGATGALLRVLTSPAPEQECPFHSFCIFFGDAVAGVDDIDGDGRGDLLVSARGEDVAGLQDAGQAYVFSTAQPFGLTAEARNSPVSQGGRLRVRVIFTNLSPAPFTGDLVLEVEGPGGVSVSRPLVSGGTLPSGDTAPTRFKLRVPPSAPPGPYTATITALDGGTAPVAEAPFAFEIATQGVHTAGAEGGAPWAVEVLDGGGLGGDFGDGLATAEAHAPAVAVWPNPAEGHVTVAFALETPATVGIVVYDVLGREVAAVEAERLAAGAHRVGLDVSALPAGVYVWRLVAGDSLKAGRLTVAR